jgi:hypothetical protein
MINLYNRRNNQEDEVPNKSVAPLTPSSSEKTKANIPKYEDPTKEFTSQELKWSFWYVRNKPLLYRLSLIVLVVINFGFLAFGGWKWGVYLWGIQDSRNLERNLTASINYVGIHPHFGAQAVQVLNTQVFSSGESKFDVVAELVNPNRQFLVKFNYYFLVNDKKTSTQAGFLLPGETRPVADLGLTDGTGVTPSIVLESIKYERISNRLAPDPMGWQTYRLNFQVSNFVFLKSLAQEGNNADAIQFKLTNGSPYSYIGPDFYIVLLQNNQMVGILPLHLETMNSLETKDIDLRSLARGLNVDAVAVYPMVNVYDEGVYAP